MEKQLNIRSNEAIDIVDAIMASTDLSRKDIVVEALRLFHRETLKSQNEKTPDWVDIFGYAKAFAATMEKAADTPARDKKKADK